MDDLKLTVGQGLAIQVRSSKSLSFRDAEFKVFSQYGDDGLLQWLISRIGIPKKYQTFVEFGVEDYQESNTRFLLAGQNWKGLIIDSGAAHLQFLQEREMLWRHDITAISALITKENINDLISKAGFIGDIGILSIDIDGNDYWVWKEIQTVQPHILVAEYNSLFGSKRAVTIPYDASFYRTKAHYSNLYWGASLRALAQIASEKGMKFVGCNSAGNNAYFVRRSVGANVPEVTVEEGFVKGCFRDSREPDGTLNYLGDFRKKLTLIEHLPLFDVEFQKIIQVRELLQDYGD